MELGGLPWMMASFAIFTMLMVTIAILWKLLSRASESIQVQKPWSKEKKIRLMRLMWKAIEQAKNNKTNKTNEATQGMNMEGLMIQFQKHEEINPRCFLL